MARRFDELERLVSDPEVIADGPRYVAFARERGALARTVGKYRQMRALEGELEETRQLVAHPEDPELAELARSEIPGLEARRDALRGELIEGFVSSDGDDHRNAIVEVRAGTGGEEAALFAADLVRMYSRYGEGRGWKVEALDSVSTELGGVKHSTFGLSGEGVYQRLKYESGVHRVQRVPVTEAQGRIHTSTATVAVLPEAEEVELEIRPQDLEIETFRASGPGGQHVNKTDSAVRIRHLPSGLVVSCQDEKSQHKNKAKALRVLRTRIYDAQVAKLHAERGDLRRRLIGTGDRSEKIRTYNFAENRVTDHRIKVSIYDLENVLLGRLDGVVDALLAAEREARMKDLDLGDASP
ncbi:MAG: peptide chain release factor 1 [Planctomycetes bacterium]|nr:peptide chain release factor 1 [Planctomycetota bacterium]